MAGPDPKIDVVVPKAPLLNIVRRHHCMTLSQYNACYSQHATAADREFVYFQFLMKFYFILGTSSTAVSNM